jgi:hemerythrin-like domain-containing protein
MSYARFGWEGSDVYIFEHVGGFIECCGCSMASVDEDDPNAFFGSARLNTAREALDHLEEHVKVGDNVPMKTFQRILADHPNLDAQIKKYVASAESEEQTKKIFDKYMKTNDSNN